MLGSYITISGIIDLVSAAGRYHYVFFQEVNKQLKSLRIVCITYRTWCFYCQPFVY